MHRTISLLGSTGSLGKQVLDIVRKNADIDVCALAVKENIDLLEEQIREFNPVLAAVYNEDKARELRVRVADTDCRIASGKQGVLEVAAYQHSDMLVTAILGMAGIEPTIEAIKSGKDIALGNKETMVCAGKMVMDLAREKHVRIIPVDSEHSAIYQCLEPENPISRIFLTCSGGPFRGYTYDQLESVTVEKALAHPTWNMGNNITIDCATLVNKGLEVIEAANLFNVPCDMIEVLVHPQSIIHSMVEFRDSAVKAQLSCPDMRLAIQYAILGPERRDFGGRRLDLSLMSRLDFEEPDTKVFRGLELAYEACRTGGSMPALFNAANENAVDRFISREISFTEITEYIEYAMRDHKLIEEPTIEEILNIKEEFNC